MSDESPALSWHSETVCAEKNTEGVNAWVSQQENPSPRKKETSGQFFFLFASTLAHSTISIKWDCAEELSLWPFSGERILARALCFDRKGTACYFTLNCNCQQLTSVLEETVMWHDYKINSFLPILWRTSVSPINILYGKQWGLASGRECSTSSATFEKDKQNILPALTRDGRCTEKHV